LNDTKVVNRRTKPFDVYIGRGSPWGNPFRIGPDGTRDEVIRKYRDWVLNSNDADALWIREHVTELKGKTLGCYCAPQPCHGDFLAILADYGGLNRFNEILG